MTKTRHILAIALAAAAVCALPTPAAAGTSAATRAGARFRMPDPRGSQYRAGIEVALRRSMARIDRNVARRQLAPAYAAQIRTNVIAGANLIRASADRAIKDGQVTRTEVLQVELLAGAIERDMRKAFGNIDPWTLLR